MELRDFECFVAVAEELHFSRAARRLAMAQPPLSLRIKALEEELGTRLLERTSRRVSLTSAGEVFLGRVQAVLALAEEAGEEAQRVGLGLAGKLTLGFVNPAMDAFLAEALARFRQVAPEMELSLREMSSREQAQALATGRIDVGFCRFAGQTIPGATVTGVSREPYILALPAGHALAGSTPLPLAALNGQPLIVPPRTGLAAVGLVAPEFQLVNEVSVAGYLNFLQALVANGLGGGAGQTPGAPKPIRQRFSSSDRRQAISSGSGSLGEGDPLRPTDGKIRAATHR